MKNLLYLFCLAGFISTTNIISAQELITTSDEIPTNFLDRNPIYDYSETQLNNTDSIPDFETKADKLMISGTIYQSDGVTPAKDVILYISQPDEDGDYVMKTENDKRYVHHRGWIKTDADGKYTFYTFIPGNFWRNKEVKHIHPIIKAPGKPEQEMSAFLFDNDPFLSKSCRKRMEKRGIDNNILKVEQKDTMYMTTKNIILANEGEEVN